MVNWFRNNLNLKLLALVLAIMLWAVVNMNNRVTQPINPLSPSSTNGIISRVIQNVPIIPRLDDPDMVIVDIPKYVNLTVKGERSALEGGLIPNQYEAYVDLNGLPSGRHSVSIRVTGFPPGVEIIANPAVVNVTLEVKQRKVMPIMAEITGKPKEGYIAGEPILSPINVHVKAAESRLKEIALVKAFINVDGASNDVKRKVPLKAYDTNGNMVEAEIDPAVAEITVPVTHPFVTVPLQIQTKGNPPDGYAVLQILSDSKTISLFGKKEDLSGIDVYAGPEIDLSGLTKTATFDLEIPNPKGLEISPKRVKVTVEIVPSVKKEFTDLPIGIIGLIDGYSAKVIDPPDGKINLTLEGAPDYINQMTNDAIKALVNLSNLAPGTHTVPLELSLPNFMKVVGEEGRMIKVEIVDQTKPASGTPEPAPSGDTPPDHPSPPTGDVGSTLWNKS